MNIEENTCDEWEKYLNSQTHEETSDDLIIANDYMRHCIWESRFLIALRNMTACVFPSSLQAQNYDE